MRRAFLVVVVEHLAVQAVDAFVGIDVAFGVDRLDRALIAAALARTAAFLQRLSQSNMRIRPGMARAAPSGHR